MKQLITFFLSLTLLCFIQSCGPVDQSTSSSTAEIDPSTMPSALQEGLTAHGGLSNWKKHGTLSFTVSSREIPETHLIDLKSRKVLIKTDSSFTMGFDGNDVWVSPELAAYSGSSPKFYHNLLFYFFSLPFVMADPGAQQAAMADITFNGTAYSRIKVTFGEKVGDSPDDQYILWFRKSDHMLQMINYSVTYFDKANASKFNAIVFEVWETVNDLKLPTKWTSYKWENDSLGDQRGTTTFENIILKEERPNEAAFEMPEQAEVDRGQN